MRGLMMDTPLSIPFILRRARSLFGHKAITWRANDGSIKRYTYADCLRRAGQLERALRRLGIGPGDRIATLAWNHARHLEAYYAVPAMGSVLHTLNLRLHPNDLQYIVNHAGDSVILVDDVLLPLWEKVAQATNVRHTIVLSDAGTPRPGMLDYETLLAAEDASPLRLDDLDEDLAAVMCYTSGTTGKPKGVLYSHRALMLHTLGACQGGEASVQETDTVLPVVPMFHANSWGLPFTCAMMGAAQVHPGPHLDPHSLLSLFAAERVTYTAGVPTIWLGILHVLDAEPHRYDLSSFRALLCGGAAVPEAMIRGFEERHGLTVIQGWGMTEMTPIGSVSVLTSDLQHADRDTKYRYRAKQGLPSSLVEIRARSENGLVPWDGETMGELEVRGPWVAAAYYNPEDPITNFTDDGWFRTGDIVTIDSHGYISVQDRAKDLIKSGGEWISSVALENELMAHPDVAEAAVVAIPHEKWDERPLAVVALKPGRVTTCEALLEHLASKFARWWIPDDIVFLPAIPKTGAGKFLKTAIRHDFRNHYGTLDPSARGEATTSA